MRGKGLFKFKDVWKSDAINPLKKYMWHYNKFKKLVRQGLVDKEIIYDHKSPIDYFYIINDSALENISVIYDNRLRKSIV